MPYCPTCAVEIEERHLCCPLCGTEVADQCPSVVGTYPQGQFVPPALPFNFSSFRRKCYAVVTTLLAIPLLIVFFLDLHDGHLTWSLYVMASIAAGWAWVGTWLYGFRKPGKLLIAQWCITAALLVALDISDRSWDWSLSLGLPLMGAVALLVGPVLGLWFARKLRLFNGIAALLVSLGLLCVVTEVLIERSMGQPPLPNWSLIPLASSIIVAAFFVYLHIRVSKHVDFDKWFHL